MKRLISLFACLAMLILPARAEEAPNGWQMTLSDWSAAVDGETFSPEVSVRLTAARSPERLLGGFCLEYGGKTLMPAQAAWDEGGMTLRLKDSSAYHFSAAEYGEATMNPAGLLTLAFALEGGGDFLPWELADSVLTLLDGLDLGDGQSADVPLTAFAAAADEALAKRDANLPAALARTLDEIRAARTYALEGDFTGVRDIRTLAEFAALAGDPMITAAHSGEEAMLGAGYVLSVKDSREALVLLPTDHAVSASLSDMIGGLGSIGVIGGADGPTSIFIARDADGGAESSDAEQSERSRGLLLLILPDAAQDAADPASLVTCAVTEDSLSLFVSHSSRQSADSLILSLSSDGAFEIRLEDCEKPSAACTLTFGGAFAGGILDASARLIAGDSEELTLSCRVQGAPGPVEDRLAGMDVLEVAAGEHGLFPDHWGGLRMAVVGWLGDAEALVNDEEIRAMDAALNRLRAAGDERPAAEDATILP